jgi:hypothetical protein
MSTMEVTAIGKFPSKAERGFQPRIKQCLGRLFAPWSPGEDSGCSWRIKKLKVLS